MKKTLAVTVFMLATLVSAVAQQPGSIERSGGQTTSSSSQQVPNGGQAQPAAPGSADQTAPQTGTQAGAPAQAPTGPVTEGCLGGSSPNFTITDAGGKTYKLNLPPNADPSVLTPHVGESVQVMGDVKPSGSTNSIDVARMARGNGKCQGGSPSSVQPPPKQ